MLQRRLAEGIAVANSLLTLSCVQHHGHPAFLDHVDDMGMALHELATNAAGAINNFLTAKTPWFDYERSPQSLPDRLTRVKNPAATVHFLIMAFEGEFAGSDHPHVEQWHRGPQSAPDRAVVHMQINAARGPVEWTGESNYGFLDGHVETAQFSGVYQDETWNRFDPLHSSGWASRRIMGGG